MIERQPTYKEYPFSREGIARIILREIQVRDDIEIALRCDKAIAADPRGMSMGLTGFLKLQKREMMRLSIVAVLREGEGAMWERVNEVDNFPEMNGWVESSFTAFLHRFNDLNEISEEQDFRKGATVCSPAEVVAKIGRAQDGKTVPVAPGGDAHAGS